MELNNFQVPISSIRTATFICKLISDYENTYKEEGVNIKGMDLDNLSFRSREEALPLFKETIRLINSSLKDLYIRCEEDNFYFFDCPLSFYEKSYAERLSQFLFKHRDSKEEDFLEVESLRLKDPKKNRTLIINDYNINYSRYLIENIDFNVAQKRKIEFIEQKTKLSANNNNNYNNEIFKGKLEEDWFNYALNELNALDENLKAGNTFQAKCSAIFYNENCKESIFKYELYLKDYIDFLKETYNATIKSSTNLSSGDKHLDEVSKLIKIYQKEWLANNSE